MLIRSNLQAILYACKTGEKADTVREYYLKMEEVLMEYPRSAMLTASGS
jgi:hypothetical protein